MTDKISEVTVKIFKCTNKDDKTYVGMIVYNDKILPIPFLGASTQEVRDKANVFYDESIGNNIDSFNIIDPRGDDCEAQSMILSAFSFKQAKGDQRRVLGKKWIHNLDKLHRMKVFEKDIPKYIDEGYKEGRGPEWDVDGNIIPTRTKRETVTNKEGYVHPFFNKRWVNKDGERLRVNKDDVQSFLDRGYTKGYGKHAVLIETPEVCSDVSIREFTTTDEEWNKADSETSA